jgi:hypothetical protein
MLRDPAMRASTDAPSIRFVPQAPRGDELIL